MATAAARLSAECTKVNSSVQPKRPSATLAQCLLKRNVRLRNSFLENSSRGERRRAGNCDQRTAVVVHKTHLLNRFMKKLTLVRAVPIIGESFLTDLGNDRYLMVLVIPANRKVSPDMVTIELFSGQVL